MYIGYEELIGEGVNSKWGSWNAMKSISSPYDGCDFGSLDNIMNKKMNWSGKLAQSQTSWVDPKTNKVTMSAADLLKMLEEAHKLTSRDLKEDKDWREMSDEEWDKMLEGIDNYIDAFKERIKQMREAQDKAAKKAAIEADAQTILMEADEAQKMEAMAQKRIEEIVNGNSEYSTYEHVTVIDSITQKRDEDIETKEPLKLIAMDRNGIRCINDDTHEVEWEIKFNSEYEYEKAAKIMKWAGSHMNNYMAATDESKWKDFLSGKISEGNFKNTLKAQEV